MITFNDIILDFVNVFLSLCLFFLAIVLAFALYCDMLLWIAFVCILPMFLGVLRILREDINNVKFASKF